MKLRLPPKVKCMKPYTTMTVLLRETSVSKQEMQSRFVAAANADLCTLTFVTSAGDIH